MNIKFVVFKLTDIGRYLTVPQYDALTEIARRIEQGRREDGRDTDNKYIVINRDEQYANEVIEIMKRHGHWDGDVA